MFCSFTNILKREEGYLYEYYLITIYFDLLAAIAIAAIVSYLFNQNFFLVTTILYTLITILRRLFCMEFTRDGKPNHYDFHAKKFALGGAANLIIIFSFLMAVAAIVSYLFTQNFNVVTIILLILIYLYGKIIIYFKTPENVKLDDD